MRGLTRRWVLRQGWDERSGGGIPGGGLFERVLRARGLEDPDEIRRFCEPRLTDLHEPDLLPNIDAAADRLVHGVREGQSIVIYGDYDVDGIAACAILYHVIKAVAPDARLQTYVPHRLEEGYGLNTEALRQLRDQGAQLVISVDCGITAQEPAAEARAIGLDLIVTDHHLPDSGEPLPTALAIVHPRLGGSRYPFGELCGAGVAYKLAWRFATTWCGSRRVGKNVQKVLLDMLPMAALGTIADVVPLVDENRTIASFGLRWIKETPIVGLRALIEAADLTGEDIDSEKVGFVLAPRLNACGRMGHAAEAVRLLTDAPPDEAGDIARRLTRLNRQRQDLERRITDQAVRRAEDAGMTADDCRAIVLADESWHAGVVGIVCSRLVDRFGRPVVLLQQQGETCKGSARSINGYSIHEGLAAAAEHLTSFGGHEAAAGLSLRTADLEAFTARLVEHANARISVEGLTPTLSIDCDATISELEIGTVRRIRSLSPFGQSNPTPTIRISQVTVTGTPKQIGANGRHLTLSLQAEHGGRRRVLRTVWFGAGARAADLASGMKLDVVIEPKINAWNGRETVEGMIRDVRVCEI
ncbi:MAG: single-stranded-DNA-specific exonuclease RecJ [Planctomycetota bacterium]|jgi:single-stranded-DNA-specific exonuclease